MGPREAEVRSSLLTRPAGMLYDGDAQLMECARRCFADLFDGANLHYEWDWGVVWPKMQRLGIVEYWPSNSPVGYSWSITRRGEAVMRDFLAFQGQLLGAMQTDLGGPFPAD